MRLPLLRTLAIGAIALASSGAALAEDPITGHTFVTLADGVEINSNIFTDRKDVFLNGNGLPEGEYYVKVIETENGNLVGTSLGTADETPVVVGEDGVFVQAYDLWSLVIKASDGTQGYDTPVAPWCEYKVFISLSPTFEDFCTKWDNFIVKEEPKETTGAICVKKFYDANANGTRDAGEIFIEKWKVFVTGTDYSETVYTTFNGTLEAGDYAFTEATPKQKNWFHSTDTTVYVTVEGGDSQTVEFGNFCIGHGGGRTPGFWSNKNGQKLFGADDLAALVSLNLVNADGTAFDPASYDEFRTWLLDSEATNMAYKLSSHVAAMRLNVLNGFVNGGSLVYAPAVGNTGIGGDFISIADLLAAADAALANDGYTPTGDSNRAAQEDLKNALDAANNNTNFVLNSPSAFSF